MKLSGFIGSSVEGLAVAKAIQRELEHDAHCMIWSQGTFGLGGFNLQELIEATRLHDFAILVFTPDDKVTVRESEMLAPRANVIFETGLFIGRHGGTNRTFIVYPRKTLGFHIPTDLGGVVMASYDPTEFAKDAFSSVGPACAEILAAIKKISPPVAVRADLQHTSKEITYPSKLYLHFQNQSDRSAIVYDMTFEFDPILLPHSAGETVAEKYIVTMVPPIPTEKNRPMPVELSPKSKARGWVALDHSKMTASALISLKGKKIGRCHYSVAQGDIARRLVIEVTG